MTGKTPKTKDEMIKHLWDVNNKLKQENLSLKRELPKKRKYYCAFCPLCGKKMKETKTGWECLHGKK